MEFQGGQGRVRRKARRIREVYKSWGDPLWLLEFPCPPGLPSGSI